MRLYYLASPYSHPDPKVRQARYEEQGRIAVELIHKGYHLIAPIEMCHHLSKLHQLPTGYQYWQARDRLLIERCDGLIACKMDGWEDSIGMKDEIKYAEFLDKEVLYYDPNRPKGLELLWM